MNYETICNEVQSIVKRTGDYIREQHYAAHSPDIEEKGTHNYVTEVDMQAERMLVDALGELLPGSGFIAEEGTNVHRSEQYNWIIDPLDGTTNFIHGVFPFAVSVALADHAKPVVGVVLELGLNECFYAWEGGGAWCNGQPIRVSRASSLNDSLIATGFPYSDYSRLDAFMSSLEWFMRNSRGLRRLGSAATDIAYVACGRYDGFYEYGLSPWDIAAGVCILDEAGGKTSDFSGEAEYLFGSEIICSNGRIHGEFVKTIENIMGTSR
jgi:myo-inositol-1(or 4)-monophosphatase